MTLNTFIMVSYPVVSQNTNAANLISDIDSKMKLQTKTPGPSLSLVFWQRVLRFWRIEAKGVVV
jgi:hypothetical protein